jgi:copper(I)-binding protein
MTVSIIQEMTMKRILGVTGMVLTTLLFSACARNAARVDVSEVWARPGAEGGNSAIYFKVENNTEQDEALLGAACEAAEHVELHMSAMEEDGTMSMHPQHSVPILSGEAVQFAPGGLHVMMIDLRGDLQTGDEFPLTLQFENTGELQVIVTVKEQ